MTVLAFSAKAGHGKDTCARIAREIAQQEFLTTFGHFAFAWPLKMRCFAMDDTLTWEQVSQKPPHVRKLFQEEGTERGRLLYGTDFWLRHADAYLRMVGEAQPELGGFTNSDSRFPNEVDFCRERGLNLYIVSDRPTLTGDAAKHPSETSLDHLDKGADFDGIIVNNLTTTLEELRAQILPHVQTLLLRRTWR